MCTGLERRQRWQLSPDIMPTLNPPPPSNTHTHTPCSLCTELSIRWLLLKCPPQNETSGLSRSHSHSSFKSTAQSPLLSCPVLVCPVWLNTRLTPFGKRTHCQLTEFNGNKAICNCTVESAAHFTHDLHHDNSFG